MAETVPPGNLNPDEAVISRAVAVFMLVVLAVASIPLLVCMPLTSDTVLYDLQAGKLLSGGTLYRDILEPNLPGIVWVHIAIRGLVGWSTLAMQSANLVIVASALTLLSWAVSSRSQFGWTFLLTSCLFFFSRNEWCHGQRDSGCCCQLRWRFCCVLAGAIVPVVAG